MLILARKSNERIMIGTDIEISVVEIRGDQVKLGIVAPASVKVYRREVFDAIQAENQEAARTAPRDLSELSGLIPKKDRGTE
ncbi:MAG: carbon storage regulator [Spirochaetaceae bacterium]|nr:MAG: carbon storage regulator [Spirochaetaceae bacterium]